MSMLDVDGLMSLRAAKEPCVSIYMPTHRRGADTLQDPIRLENLAKDAARQLDELGCDRRTAERVLAPVHARAADIAGWPLAADGLAILAWDGDHRSFPIPRPPSELCVVGPRLYTKPLLATLDDGARFGVLVLSQKAVRWFDGTRAGLRAVEHAGLPRDIAAVVGTDFGQGIQQYRSAGMNSSEGRGRSSTYSGHGGGPDDSRAELEKFARAVDDAVCRIVRDRPCPVAVAASEPLASVYRRISKLRDLLPDAISGNFETDNGTALFERVWPLVAPKFQAAQDALAARIKVGLGTGKVVQRIEDVVRAAREGRIDAMFAATDAHRWAAADVDAVPHAERAPGDVDLIDVAATDCLLHGGQVHAVPAASIPGDHAVVAAALRF